MRLALAQDVLKVVGSIYLRAANYIKTEEAKVLRLLLLHSLSHNHKQEWYIKRGEYKRLLVCDLQYSRLSTIIILIKKTQSTLIVGVALEIAFTTTLAATLRAHRVVGIGIIWVVWVWQSRGR